MVGEQDLERALRKLDHRDAGAHPVDGEDKRAAQDVGEVPRIGGNVLAGDVEEIELLEGRRC